MTDAPRDCGALVAAVDVAGAEGGPLHGVDFVAKDLFDVAGTVTGAGLPQWADQQQPAPTHAAAVHQLLAAGGHLVGKAHTAAFAFSLSGDNVHYGMPPNGADRTREPGGSSSGSAAAVSTGLAPLALGTDTLGSARLPASYCGLFGWRPSHGRVDMAGVHPLAPRFDTVGLLAQSGSLLAGAGRVLLDRPRAAVAPRRLLVAEDGFARCPPPVRADLRAEVERCAAVEELAPEPTDLLPAHLSFGAVVEAMRDLQGPDVWRTHGDWITATAPTWGPGVADRFAYAASVTVDQERAAERVAEEVTAHLSGLLGPGDVLALPVATGPAPRRAASAATRQAARADAAALAVVASLAGVPSVVTPATTVDGGPVGLAWLAAPGGDEALLALVSRRSSE